MSINKSACLILITDQEKKPKQLNSVFYFNWDTKQTKTAELVAILPNLQPLVTAFQEQLSQDDSGENITAFLQIFGKMYQVPQPEYAIVDLRYLATLVETHLNNQVTITLKKAAVLTNGLELKKGSHQLTGRELVDVFRYNHHIADYDCCQRQQALIFTLAKQVIKKAGILGLPKLLTTTKVEINTSASVKTGMSLAKSYLMKQIKKTTTSIFPMKDSYELVTNNALTTIELKKKADNH